jgi:uncharacterized protein with gpF-like domain
MNRKPIDLKAARPNLGVAANYQRQLDSFIDQMHKSILYWVTAAYRANTPEIAQDASPAVEMQKVMTKLARRWTKAFNGAAKEIAALFADKAMGGTDANMKAILKRAGFTVPFKRTAAVNDAYQSVIFENVGLIKSIASEHLSDVQGLVMRSVQAGRDLGPLRDDLVKRYGVTKKRAALIARDQNNKATSVMDRARMLSLGITQAKWVHSGGGVHPRPSHVNADGEIFDVAKGCLIDGEYIQPGELINCRCVKRAIIPGFDD